MANMTFKTNLLPNSTTLEYSLGSENQPWKINGYNIEDTYVHISGDTMLGLLKTKGLAGTENIDYGEVLPTTAVDGQLFFQISNGYTYELPQGGTSGQALIKNSNNDRDVIWANNVLSATKATQDKNGLQIDTGYLKLTGGTMTGAITMNKSAQQLIVPYNGTNYDVLHNHNNGNYSLSACGGGLYMGYYNTTLMNWLSGKMTLTSAGDLSNTGWTSQNGPEYQRCTAVTRGTAYNGDFYRTAPEWTDSAGNRVAQIEYHKSASYNELLLYALGDVAASNLYAGLVIRRALGNTGNASCVLDANAGKLYGAVWNDYAEFRESKITEPGRCIKETGNGDLILSEKRLEKGCEIISDTYGFAIGQSKKYNTPTACTGRVLAYPYEPIEEFKKNIGQGVCSGPNGTVSIMTDEECRDWPQCIIGTISEIPNYDVWYAGGENEGSTPIKVNDRIWIRVR